MGMMTLRDHHRYDLLADIYGPSGSRRIHDQTTWVDQVWTFLPESYFTLHRLTNSPPAAATVSFQKAARVCEIILTDTKKFYYPRNL